MYLHPGRDWQGAAEVTAVGPSAAGTTFEEKLFQLADGKALCAGTADPPVNPGGVAAHPKPLAL